MKNHGYLKHKNIPIRAGCIGFVKLIRKSRGPINISKGLFFYSRPTVPRPLGRGQNGLPRIRLEGYFVSTVGINEAIIRRYIEHQGQADAGQTTY